jgi:pyruvate,water dikinase
MIVFLILVGEKQVWSAQILQDVARILTVDKESVDVESAGVPHGLKKLSNAISSAEGWKENFAHANLPAATLWLSENLGTEMKEFLSKFGHRCLKEFELVSHPWEEDMSPVVSTLQAMLKGGETSYNTSEPVQNTQNHVLTGSKIKDFLLGCLIPLAHQSVGRREESKSMLIRAVHQIRLAYRALASLLVQKNLIPSRELIAFFSHYELRQLVSEHRTDLVPKALRRQKLLAKLEHLEFPEIVIGCRLNESTPPAQTGSDLIAGTPACPGQVSGPARVITRLDEAATILPGDILITTSTDIGWSPYFPMLGGVVTELGGLISHGAVVAREYGLPCLVGARGATRLFSTGDMVRIDTQMGIVYKIYT